MSGLFLDQAEEDITSPLLNQRRTKGAGPVTKEDNDNSAFIFFGNDGDETDSFSPSFPMFLTFEIALWIFLLSIFIFLIDFAIVLENFSFSRLSFAWLTLLVGHGLSFLCLTFGLFRAYAYYSGRNSVQERFWKSIHKSPMKAKAVERLNTSGQFHRQVIYWLVFEPFVDFLPPLPTLALLLVQYFVYYLFTSGNIGKSNVFTMSIPLMICLLLMTLQLLFVTGKYLPRFRILVFVLTMVFVILFVYVLDGNLPQTFAIFIPILIAESLPLISTVVLFFPQWLRIEIKDKEYKYYLTGYICALVLLIIGTVLTGIKFTSSTHFPFTETNRVNAPYSWVVSLVPIIVAFFIFSICLIVRGTKFRNQAGYESIANPHNYIPFIGAFNALSTNENVEF